MSHAFLEKEKNWDAREGIIAKTLSLKRQEGEVEGISGRGVGFG
jgi:hypothetical protein